MKHRMLDQIKSESAFEQKTRWLSVCTFTFKERKQLLINCLTLIFLAIALQTHAQDAIWNNTDNDGNWDNPNNWTNPPGMSASSPITINGALIINASGLMNNLPASVTANRLEVNANFSIPSGVDLKIIVPPAPAAIGVTVGSGDSLSIQTGGKLSVIGATMEGIDLSGYLSVGDTLFVQNTSMDGLLARPSSKTVIESNGVFLLDSIGQSAIDNNDTIINNGEVLIMNVDDIGIEQSNSSAQYWNRGVTKLFHIRNGAGIETIDGAVLNDNGGILTVSHVNNASGISYGGASFENFGTIIIDSINGNGIDISQSSFVSDNDTILIGTNHILTGTGASVGSSVITGNAFNITADYNIANNSYVRVGDSTKTHILGSGISVSNATVEVNNPEDLDDESRILIAGVSQHGITLSGSGGFRSRNGTSIEVLQVGTNATDNAINIEGTAQFENDGATLIIGDSTKNNITGNGIRVASGATFRNYSTTAKGGGMVLINGVSQDGINNANDFINGDLVPNIGDTLGIIRIDNVGGDGIDNSNSGDVYNIGASQIFIGSSCVPVGIRNSGTIHNGTSTIDDRGTTIIINALTTAIINTAGMFRNGDGNNNDECVLLQTNTPLMVTGGSLVNDDIFNTTSTAANTASAGLITNNGIITDPGDSFASDLAGRLFGPSINGVSTGVIVSPIDTACFTTSITNYLIPSANVAGAAYLPDATFRDIVSGAQIATFDAGTNILTINQAANNMQMSFDIESNGNSCGINGIAMVTFGNITNPAITCNSNIQVSLGANCQAFLDPNFIIEGTAITCTDGYVVEILEGSRIGQDTIDASYIGQTINVMVTAPNGNRCWGAVTVEDKLPPVLTCRDTFIYCTQDSRPEVLGFPTAVDACGDTVTFTYADQVSPATTGCGADPSNPDTMSIIIRTFTGRDVHGNADTCTQSIYVLRPTMADVRIPASLTGSNALQCSAAQTDPSVTGRPFFLINGDTILVEAICKFGVDLDEKVSSLGCTGKSRIVRTWTIWDWCHISAGNSVMADTQVIDIIDTIPPTFDSIRVSEIVILSTQAHKCMATIKPPIPQNMQDACSGTTFRILGPTGTIYNNPLDSFINVPLDTHTLEYIVSDSCGNETRDTITFILRDEIAPLALAQELTVNLVDGAGNTWVYASSFDAGSSDNCSGLDSILISKDGINFAERVAFDCSDIGTKTLTLKVIDKVGLSSTATREVQIQDTGGFCTPQACNTGVTIDTAFMMIHPSNCDTKDGELIVVATTNGANIEYSIDSGKTYQALSVPFLNQDTSLKYVFVREVGNPTCVTAFKGNPIQPEGGCVSLTANATIAGHIQNENGELVEDVNISIGGYEMAPITTGANGTFMFEEIPLNGDYMITPEKDMNYGNGITTFDIVLLSKHVLGLKPLDSPYKLIAADVNHSGTISAYDMVLLRQVILGAKNDFPNNSSWRFIDADYEFLQPENPFAEDYPEAYEINRLAADMMTLDFVAVKVGDVNNSAAANQLMTAESRNTNKSLNFQIIEQVKKTGEMVTVDFTAKNFQSMLGYQFTLDFDGNALEFDQLLIGKQAGFENFNLSMVQRGIITTSWGEAEAVSLEADEVLFSLVFKAKKDIRLSDVIQIGSDITPAEAYTATEDIINVDLVIDQPMTNPDGLKLYQNKPNPFTGETIIGFELPSASSTTMTIFDMSGKVVRIIKGTYEKGYHQITIDGKAFNEHGMFYYQLTTANGIETKKMILLK